MLKILFHKLRLQRLCQTRNISIKERLLRSFLYIILKILLSMGLRWPFCKPLPQCNTFDTLIALLVPVWQFVWTKVSAFHYWDFYQGTGKSIRNIQENLSSTSNTYSWDTRKIYLTHLKIWKLFILLEKVVIAIEKLNSHVPECLLLSYPFGILLDPAMPFISLRSTFLEISALHVCCNKNGFVFYNLKNACMCRTSTHVVFFFWDRDLE